MVNSLHNNTASVGFTERKKKPAVRFYLLIPMLYKIIKIAFYSLNGKKLHIDCVIYGITVKKREKQRKRIEYNENKTSTSNFQLNFIFGKSAATPDQQNCSSE